MLKYVIRIVTIATVVFLVACSGEENSTPTVSSQPEVIAPTATSNINDAFESLGFETPTPLPTNTPGPSPTPLPTVRPGSDLVTLYRGSPLRFTIEECSGGRLTVIADVDGLGPAGLFLRGLPRLQTGDSIEYEISECNARTETFVFGHVVSVSPENGSAVVEIYKSAEIR